MAAISSLPQEIQGIILTYYMGNSFARYSFLKHVFSGEQFVELSHLVDMSFRPTVYKLYLRQSIVSDLGLRESDDIQWVDISTVIRLSGRYSGLVEQIQRICSDAVQWCRGRLALTGGHLGWYFVASFEPLGNRWDFV